MSELETKPSRIEIQGPDEMVIRQFGPEDTQPYFDLIDRNREHLSQHGDLTAQNYPTVEAVREKMENPDPNRLRFGIWTGDTLIGTINLDRTEMEHHGREGIEIGYWIGKEYIGRGYARKAAQAIIPFAFKQPGVHRIYGQVAKENKASIQTLENCGFNFVKDDGFGFLDYELLKSTTSAA